MSNKEANRQSTGKYKGEIFHVSIPKVIPQALLGRLAQLFVSSASYVEEAYYGLVHFPSHKDEKPLYWIGIRFSKGAESYEKELGLTIGRIASETLPHDQYADLIPIRDTTYNLTLFYTKGKKPEGK
jgi:hypothetical protein